MASADTSSLDRGSDGLQGPAGSRLSASPVSSPIKRNVRLAEQVDSAMPKVKREKGKKKAQTNTAVPEVKREDDRAQAQCITSPAPVPGKKPMRILLSTKTFKWVKNAAGDWVKVPTQAPARKPRKRGEKMIKEGEQKY